MTERTEEAPSVILSPKTLHHTSQEFWRFLGKLLKFLSEDGEGSKMRVGIPLFRLFILFGVRKTSTHPHVPLNLTELKTPPIFSAMIDNASTAAPRMVTILVEGIRLPCRYLGCRPTIIKGLSVGSELNSPHLGRLLSLPPLIT